VQILRSTRPDVVLNVEHVIPVSKGGTNDILNLVTACADCNSGKGARLLDDRAALEKARNQMEELQEKRNQMAMMVEWRKDLLKSKDSEFAPVYEYWNYLVGTATLTESGKKSVRALVKKFSPDEVLAAMEIAVEKYAKYGDIQSICTAFQKLGGVCYYQRKEKTVPEIRKLAYIVGILKNRLHWTPYGLMDRLIEISAVVPISEMQKAAEAAYSWQRFEEACQ
jgi:hypothetical protein